MLERTVFPFILGMALLVFFTGTAHATDNGNLGLLVTDKNYNPITKAQVNLDGNSAGKTSSDGTLLLKDLSPGEHTLVEDAPKS